MVNPQAPPSKWASRISVGVLACGAILTLYGLGWLGLGWVMCWFRACSIERYSNTFAIWLIVGGIFVLFGAWLLVRNGVLFPLPLVAIVWSIIVGASVVIGLGAVKTPERAEAARPPLTVPCEPGYEQFAIGTPRTYFPRSDVSLPRVIDSATFAISGGRLYMTYAGDQGGGGFLDGFGADSASVSLGSTTNPPAITDNTAYNTIISPHTKVSLSLDRFVEIELLAGEYWVLTSGGSDFYLYACNEGSLSNVSVSQDSPPGTG